MITLHIAQFLANSGIGVLNQDIFWEDMPIAEDGKPIDGMWVVPRGSALNRFNTTTQAFDIYSRYADKITGSQKLEDILLLLQDAYDTTCELPVVAPDSFTRYYDVRLRPVSGISNVGADAQDKVVRVISGEVQYNIDKES